MTGRLEVVDRRRMFDRSKERTRELREPKRPASISRNEEEHLAENHASTKKVDAMDHAVVNSARYRRAATYLNKPMHGSGEVAWIYNGQSTIAALWSAPLASIRRSPSWTEIEIVPCPNSRALVSIALSPATTLQSEKSERSHFWALTSRGNTNRTAGSS